ncbi:MAG TPA: winged helix-turn-helix domain-containing protein [Actinocrinis sp.]|nr:winged helix-turn-helix domain-containing protein [Actinocrinis sp.]
MISVRYPDGGGLTAAQREKRERLRVQAAELFAAGIEPPQVALRLRVSRNSAYRWRRAWVAGGTGALASKGPSGSPCRLSARQLERLSAALEAGPAVYGWDQDQRWTGARVATLIGRLFHVRYTVRGATYLLHRLGFSAQVPLHRAAERDEQAVTTWKESTWSEIKG